jgi:mannose/fructose-specific phosphotransferase system component IIA
VVPTHIILTSHGPLAEGLRQTAEMIAGVSPALVVVSLAADEDREAFAGRLGAALSTGATLVLCDLYFGTPHTTALRLTEGRPDVQVLAGVNLAMALEAILGAETDDLGTLAAQVRAAGRAGLGDG